MQFHWLWDQVNQLQFCIYSGIGEDNLADYFTKHHPSEWYRRMRPRYVLDTEDI